MKTSKTIDKTKNLISLALVRLMYRKSYDEITVKEICQNAGVSRMSFYRYFDKKEDVFIDYCDARFEEFYDEYLNRTTVSLEEFVLDTFKFFKKYNRQLMILRQAGKEQILVKQFNGYAKYLIVHNSNKLVLEQRKNPVIGPFLAGGLYNVLATWLDDGMEQSPEEMRDLLLQIPFMIAQSL